MGAGCRLCEIKDDGYRLLARIDGAEIKLFTRKGHDWSSKLASLHAASAGSKLPSGWYDGEMVPPDDRGVPDLSKVSGRVRISEVFGAVDGSIASVLGSGCKLGLEGVIAKRRDSVYRSGRSAQWIKLKCGLRPAFVIGGYTDG